MTSQRTMWIAIVSVLLVGLALSGAQQEIVAEEAAPPVVPDHACAMADRANLALLLPLLERNAPNDVTIVERAIHALNLARRRCQYGWTEMALDNYRWLTRWLEDHR
jgi:hypothetical protein